MSEPLSAADRSSLAAEQGPVNMAVGGLLVVDRGPAVTREAIVRRVQERLHLLPRLRQRVSEPLRGLAGAVWADDPGFDAHWHVRATALDPPGGDAELGALVGREMSRRLDRARPLWELLVVDGLAGDRVALLLRLHHALTDGMAALAAGVLLLDPTPEPLVVEPPPEPWAAAPDDSRRHLLRLAAAPMEAASRLALESAARARDPSPRRAADELRRASEGVVELARGRPQAPMTPLNEPLGANRSFALASAPLAPVKAAARAAGATVNDAVLATVAGALGAYLDAAGTVLERPPVALVPVSLRGPGHGAATGNRISTVLVDLPAGERDPLRRLAAVAEETRRVKSSAAVRAGAVAVGATGWAPPLVSGALARAMGSVRAFNVVVSNVPGPQQPFYLGGARVRAAIPVVPLNPANQRLTVGVLSYDGELAFGLLADADLDPPVTVAAAGVRDALAGLLDRTSSS